MTPPLKPHLGGNELLPPRLVSECRKSIPDRTSNRTIRAQMRVYRSAPDIRTFAGPRSRHGYTFQQLWRVPAAVGYVCPDWASRWVQMLPQADWLWVVVGRAQLAPEGDHGAARAVVVRHRLAHREAEALVEADRVDVAGGSDGT